MSAQCTLGLRVLEYGPTSSPAPGVVIRASIEFNDGILTNYPIESDGVDYQADVSFIRTLRASSWPRWETCFTITNISVSGGMVSFDYATAGTIPSDAKMYIQVNNTFTRNYFSISSLQSSGAFSAAIPDRDDYFEARFEIRNSSYTYYSTQQRIRID